METEFKIRCSSTEPLQKILDDEQLKTHYVEDSFKEQSFVSRYYDTASFDLCKRKASLRVRQIDGHEHYEHTIKLGGSEKEGLHRRYEWNHDTNRACFDATSFLENAFSDQDPDALLKDILSSLEEKELIEICQTTFMRTTIIATCNESIIEMAFDEGELSAGGRTEPIFEIELELISGDESDLMEISRRVLDISGGVPEKMNKFVRCLRLMGIEDKL